MKRRDFVTKAGAGIALAGSGLACGDSDEGPIDSAPNIQTGKSLRWRLASSYPRSVDTIYGAAEVMSERLSNLTDGKFNVRVFPPGELVPGLEVLDAVQKGTVQVGHTASYYYVGKNPVLAFDCCVPFGMTARQQNAWLLQGNGQKLLRGAFSDFNILNFPGGNTGVQMGGWFRKEINSTGDLRGLKMRIPGMGGRVMDKLGATVQVIAGGEIYQALERGTIDAAEWVGPYDDLKLGFNKVAKYYYYPGWWEPGPTLSFYVNQQAWDGLTHGYQQAFEVACLEANQHMLAAYDAKNPAALKTLLESGTEVRKFSDDIMSAAEKESFALFEEEALASSEYKAIYKDWKKFRSDSYEWSSLAETAFASFAFGK